VRGASSKFVEPCYSQNVSARLRWKPEQVRPGKGDVRQKPDPEGLEGDVTKNNQSISANINASFQDLAAAAGDLNQASDELMKFMSELDTALKALNLGIECWVEIGRYSKPDVSWADELGFAKVSGKWGLALRSVELGDKSDDDPAYWLFNEASRDMRIEAVDFIPDLLKALREAAALKTDQVRTKLDSVRRVTATDGW